MLRGARPGVPVVWLDAGNFLSEPSARSRRENEIEVAGMRRLGVAVANVGPLETAWGLDGLASLLAGQAIPLVSANLTRTDGSPAPFPAWRRVDVAVGPGHVIRLGVLGATESAAAGAGWEAADVVESVRRWVPAARAESDLVVLLLAGSPDLARRVAEDVPELDAVIGADPRVQGPVTVGRTVIVHPGQEGQNLVQLDVRLGAGRRPALDARLVRLSRDRPADPELEELVRETVAAVNRDRVADAEGEAPTLRVETDVLSRLGVTAVASGTVPGADRGPVPPSATCVACHPAEHAAWQASVHARAEPSVGCDACHGPGGVHLRTLGQPWGEVTDGACARCHEDGVTIAASWSAEAHAPAAPAEPGGP